MKIVIHSPAFPPQIGGLEEIARICATGLTERGHEVTVLCETPNEPPVDFPFRVLRRASFREAFQITRECDVFLMFNMSLKSLFLPVLWRKPLVICHQGWYGRGRDDLDIRARLKIWLARSLAINIACSRAVAEYLGGPVTVIPNAYNDAVFRLRPEVPRNRDVLFVGRLVSDKGASLLVEALGSLVVEGLRPTITITGAGPEEEPLRRQVTALGLEAQTLFTGPLRGEALARTMNEHRILVVPSRWEEPFGIVAVEGIASGCLVIGSRKGGLGEAIGKCGLLFENGSLVELTAALKTAIHDSAEVSCSSAERTTHLDQHRRDLVVRAYEKVLWCE
jgi:glycogen(starch) synthase